MYAAKERATAIHVMRIRPCSDFGFSIIGGAYRGLGFFATNRSTDPGDLLSYGAQSRGK